jgi:hypothetical protein
MTDYTKSTNFATKDSLSSGNALKILKGTEIDTEFNNIATAVATKADIVSPTFTGTPTLPTGTTGVTQSTTDSSTKLATTAFVQAVAQVLFPVGAIYTATVSTNPATLLGFGTWIAFGAGRTIIGNGGGYTAGNTGGSADAIVVSHTHTATESSHTHSWSYSEVTSGDDAPNGGTTCWVTNSDSTGGGGTKTISGTTGGTAATVTVASTGSSATNANLPPYIVVYMWQRTA